MIEKPMEFKLEVLTHAIRTVFWTMAKLQGWTDEYANAVIEGWVEKLRLETFPTDDPVKSMYAADEFAEAFEDVFRRT